MGEQRAELSRTGLRKLWFQVHKWIGLLLAVLIVPISLSGAALVWHDWLDEAVNPPRYAVSSGEAALPPSAYAQAARSALPEGSRIATIRYPDGKGPLIVTAIATSASSDRGGMPSRINVWLDPADAAILDKAGNNEGLVRVLHSLHANLLVPGAGRQIVGWLGVALLLSALSGLWLWWPTSGRISRALRWRRTREFDSNLHHQMGFWIALPLAMLSFTGVWIAFPAMVAGISGPAGGKAGPSDEWSRRMRTKPLAQTRLSVDAALATSGTAKGTRIASIAWPTDMKAAWKIGIARAVPTEIEVDDTSGKAKPAPGGKQQGIARLMRRLHDGTGMGVIWQTIIFIAGVLPSVLAITGILMWLRTRRWRGRIADRQRSRRALQVT